MWGGVAVRRRPNPVTLAKRFVALGGKGMHTRYQQVTTAKMDPNWPSWLEEYEFDDLPYSHKDLFHPHQSSIRQMRLIEAEVVGNLMKEDRVPPSLISHCNEIFTTVQQEKDRVTELWWEIEDMYRRTHPAYLKAQSQKTPITYKQMTEIGAALRTFIRDQHLAGKIVFEYTEHLVEPIRAKHQEAKVTNADFVALAQANAVQAAGGPTIPFRFGREETRPLAIPDLDTEDADALKKRFPDLSPDEIVALGSLQGLREAPHRFSRNYLRSGMATQSKAFADKEMNQAVAKYVKDFDLLTTSVRDVIVKVQEQGHKNLSNTPLPPRPGAVDDWGVELGTPENRSFNYPESLTEQGWRKLQEGQQNQRQPPPLR